MQDDTDQQAMERFFPMVAALHAAFEIDQNIGDVLDVPDLPLPAPDLKQEIEGAGKRIGRIEAKRNNTAQRKM
jgi:hypothetical protein